MPFRRIPFWVHLAYLIVALLLVFALISNSFQYFESRRLITAEVAQRYQLLGQNAIGEVHETYRAAKLGAALMAKQRLISASNLEQRLDSLPWLSAALQAQPNANAMYMGYASGDFFMLRPWRGDAKLQARFDPPAGTGWMVQSIQVVDGKQLGEHLFFSPELRLLERRAKPDYRYDPRTRGWYQQAMLSDAVVIRPPYVFASSSEVGSSFSQRSDNALGVSGVDITLRSLQQILTDSRVTTNTRIALINAKGEVLSSHLGAVQMMLGADGKERLPTLHELDLPMLAKLIEETPTGSNLVKHFEDAQGNT